MKISKLRVAGWLAAGFVGLLMLAQPGRLMAQTATIHGHVQNPAGQPVTVGEVRLTTDKNPSAPGAKFEYAFPIDGSGNYKGTDIKPGNYIAGVFAQGRSVDFMPQQSFAAGENKTVDFDMTRPEYIKGMSQADRDALEEYKKKNAEVTAANAKIENLNKLLTDARTATKAGNFDQAVKDMTDATAAKPDEAILWDTLGDAQLGLANAALKTARDNKTTDPSLGDKFQAAITSYQKSLSLDTASGKPNTDLEAAANNQMAQALGHVGKMADASAAYEAAAKVDPTKASMYYFNEAATLFNSNDMDGAAAAAQKAITADPTKVDAYYILGQSLIQKATVDPATNKITAPPECIAAYNKYLELAPNGPHAEEIKGILQGIGATVQANYKSTPTKKK
ncbi:MAG: tetratricopeptide repeat protein [Acidobacteriaceae bacterium]|jgi:tetratricopeptide (TPR) repeat protein